MALIKDKIKQDLLQARKDKQQLVVTELSTLLGEIERVDANKLTEELEISIVKKYLDNLFLAAQTSDLANQQYGMVQGYLPTQLTTKETSSIISQLENKSIPAVMKHFSAHYMGKHDKKVISELLKNL